jgi:hypothetical protein
MTMSQRRRYYVDDVTTSTFEPVADRAIERRHRPDRHQHITFAGCVAGVKPVIVIS